MPSKPSKIKGKKKVKKRCSKKTGRNFAFLYDLRVDLYDLRVEHEKKVVILQRKIVLI